MPDGTRPWLSQNYGSFVGVGILLKIDNSILQFHQNQDRKSTKCFAIFIIVSQMYIFVFNLLIKLGDKYKKIDLSGKLVTLKMEGHSNCVEILNILWLSFYQKQFKKIKKI